MNETKIIKTPVYNLNAMKRYQLKNADKQKEYRKGYNLKRKEKRKKEKLNKINLDEIKDENKDVVKDENKDVVKDENKDVVKDVVKDVIKHEIKDVINDLIPIKGQIYLIKMCDTNNRTIYKIGRTNNFYERNNSYLFAEILNVIRSDNIAYDESEIIKIFIKNCKLEKGREYFTGESDEFVLKIVLDYFINKINQSLEVNKPILT